MKKKKCGTPKTGDFFHFFAFFSFFFSLKMQRFQKQLFSSYRIRHSFKSVLVGRIAKDAQVQVDEKFNDKQIFFPLVTETFKTTDGIREVKTTWHMIKMKHSDFNERLLPMMTKK